MEPFGQSAAVPVQKSFLNQFVALLFFGKVDIKYCDCLRRRLEVSKLQIQYSSMTENSTEKSNSS